MNIEDQLRAHYEGIGDEPAAEQRLAQYAAALADGDAERAPEVATLIVDSPERPEASGPRRVFHSRRALAVLVAAAVVVAVAAIGYGLSGSPKSAPPAGTHRSHPPSIGNVALSRIPTHPPVTHHPASGCDTSRPSLPGDVHDPLPIVDAHTTGAVIIWLPGMNSKACLAYLTLLSAAAARDLARRINSAPAYPTGELSCNFDMTAASVYFRVAGSPGNVGQHIALGLSGCGGISAERRWPRKITAGMLEPDLGTVAPPAWRPYLAYGW